MTRSSSSTTGSLSHVWALDAPRPWAMWIDLIVESGSSWLTTRPPSRVDRNGSTIAMRRRCASAVTASALAWSVATVPGSSRQMRVSILPPSSPRSPISAAEYAVNRSSSSKLAPWRPPRFIDPMASLSSRAPSSRRSSSTSGVPRTPSTPGRDSAVARRSSRSLRLAIAAPAPRTPRAPLAGSARGRQGGGGRSLWSSGLLGDGRGREGRGEPLVDLGGRGHGGGALELAGDDGAGDVRELEDAAQVPPRQQSVAQGPAERVAGPEPVDDVDGERRHLDALVTRRREHALGPLLDDGQLDAALEEGIGRALRLGLADRHLALLAVADGDGDVLEGRTHLGARLGGAAPEHRPVVEVEDRVPSAGPGGPRGEVCRTARFLAQPRDRRPVEAGRADRVERQLVGLDEQVGRDRVAVEVEREVVGREDLAEGHRGRRPVDGRDEPVVDAEVAQCLVDVPAERVLADAGQQGDASAVPRGGDGDVRGAAAEELLEGADLLETDAVLQGVDVDAGAADGDDVVRLGAVLVTGAGAHSVSTSSRRTTRPSWRDSSHASGTRNAARASSTVHGEGRTPRATAANAVSSAR